MILKKTRRSLISKILMALIVITIGVNVFAANIVENDIRLYIDHHIEEEVTLILKSLDWAIAPLIQENNSANIQRLIDHIGSHDIVESISVYDENYEILYSNIRNYINVVDENDCVKSILIDKKLKAISNNRKNKTFEMAIPLKSDSFNSLTGTDVKNTLLVSVDTDYIINLQNVMLYKIKLVYILSSILFIVLILIIIIKYVGIPIKKMSYGIDQIYNRNYDYRLNINNSNEFVLLSNFFNDMVEDIENNTTKLTLQKNRAEKEGKAKLEFLARMSHEIRTPLNTIIGFSELLEEGESDEEKKVQMNIIKNSGTHLLSVINDILDFTKIGNNKIKLERIRFSIREELYIIHEMFLIKAKQKGLKFYIKIDELVPNYFYGDIFRLRQVIINILSNAFKFTEIGFVKIEVEFDNEVLKIIIEDSGVGISIENQKNIFDAFKQADESTTREYGGTGLGLAISKQLVELMNGKILLDSVKNEGTKFIIQLKLDFDNRMIIEAKNKSLNENKEFRKNKNTFEVLIAEDVKDNRLLMKMMLSKIDNLMLDFAEDGQIAIDKLKIKKYDLLLLDMQMPVKDGETVLKIIKNDLKLMDLEIIAVTANADDAYRQKCIKLGCDDFVSKPINKKIIVDKILSLMNNKNI